MSTTARWPGILLLLAVSATSAGADWDQVFKQTAEPQPAATQSASAPAARTRALQTSPTRTTAQSAATRAGSRKGTGTTPNRGTQAEPGSRPDSPADLARGIELYRNGRIGEAASIFEARALAADTPAEQSTTMFKVGVQWHNEVLKAAADKRAEVRGAAVSAYRKTLEIDPRSGPALNNLAQLLKTDPANTAEADRLLAQAVALDDSRKGVYLMNRAELKRDAGELDAAADFARQAATDDEGNVHAHQLLMNILFKRQDARALHDYLRDLRSRGLVVRALDSAAQGLAQWPGGRKTLLISMATTLGDSGYTADPARFRDTDAGKALASYSADPAIGVGVNELFQVLSEPARPASLHWWREGFQDFDEPSPDSPARALQQLTRRCGEIYEAAGEVARAEGYYRTSVTLSGRMNPDSRALLGLSGILYEQNRLDELNQVLRENENGLMAAKGRSIAASDYLHTYELRVALGMMYGYVERWVNPSQHYAASIWMLENAQDSAGQYNAEARLPAGQRIRLPPNAVKMLSKGYAKTRNEARSVAVRLEFAEAYLESGQKKFAQLVLDPDWQRSLPATLDAATRQRIADLRAQAGA